MNETNTNDLFSPGNLLVTRNSKFLKKVNDELSSTHDDNSTWIVNTNSILMLIKSTIINTELIHDKTDKKTVKDYALYFLHDGQIWVGYTSDLNKDFRKLKKNDIKYIENKTYNIYC